MDASMQEIIKSIIQIDKSAEDIRKNFEEMINERKQLVYKNIAKLREEIVEEQLKKVKEMKCENTKRTNIEAKIIRQNAVKKSNEMYEKFLSQKEVIVREIFNEIIKA